MLLVGCSGRAITRAYAPTSLSGTAAMRYSTPASETPDRAENPRPRRATASSSGPSTSRSPLVGHEEGAAVGPAHRDRQVVRSHRAPGQVADRPQVLHHRTPGQRRRGAHQLGVQGAVERDPERDVAGDAGRRHGQGHGDGGQVRHPALQRHPPQPGPQPAPHRRSFSAEGTRMIMAASRAARSPPRVRCGSAGTRARPRSCGGGSRCRPRASWPWSGSRSPTPRSAARTAPAPAAGGP